MDIESTKSEEMEDEEEVEEQETVLSPSASSSSVVETKKTYTLFKEEELRLEITEKELMKVKVKKGTAELFGTELALDKEYSFQNCNVAIFTWHGCTIECEGSCKMAYTEGDTPMISFVNTHAALENLRNEAAKFATDESKGDSDTELDEKGLGPRVMVVGPNDSGKSTLCRMLLSYAVRAERHPIFVDLDVAQNGICIPGTMAAVPVETMIDAENGLNAKVPLVHFFGYTTPTHNFDLYKKTVDRLATSVFKRLNCVPEARTSGLIINTCGLADEAGYKLMHHVAKAFKVNVVLVVGDERLYSLLTKSKHLSEANVSIAKLNRSGGVVKRDPKQKRAFQSRAIRKYFYGNDCGLFPHQKVIKFDDVTICKIGGNAKAPKSALPIGRQSVLDPSRVTISRPGKDLVHCIISVAYSNDPRNVLAQNVAGFLHVTNVDTKAKNMTCLTPCPGPLPGQLLLRGGIEWIDT